MQREDKVSLLWFENGRYLVADYYTKIDVLGYLNSGMWLLCDKDGNVIENYIEEKSMTTVQKKQISDYIDYDFYTPNTEEVQEFLKMNFELSNRYNEWVSTHDFITPTYSKKELFTTDNNWGVFISTEQFKKLIGMDITSEKSDTKLSTKQKIDQLLSTRGEEAVEWLTDKLKEFVKRENIRKELEFAEAKKVRLEKHIDVLKSKLQ